MPYKKAGLTEKEAALHLLNRLAFGPTPGQVEKVMSMGLDQWVMAQLNQVAAITTGFRKEPKHAWPIKKTTEDKLD